jgi:predicted negative regulator of RcsB-dependent stress response
MSVVDPAMPASFADFAITRRMELANIAVSRGRASEALNHAEAALRHAARLTLDCLTVQRIADVVVRLEDIAASQSPSQTPPGAA